MPHAEPYVHFKEEPAFIREQVCALGGSVIRHDFGERCYNPGIAPNRWRVQFGFLASDFLMTYRSQEISRDIAVSNLSLCGVDRCGKVKWTAPLDLHNLPGEGVPMHEDGRLFWLQNRLFLAYSNVRLRERDVSFKQSLVELRPSLPSDMIRERVFKPSFEAGPLKHLNFGTNSPKRRGHEKNWQFFDDDGELSFVYSIHPHVTICPNRNEYIIGSNGRCGDWQKAWGNMHGGTPPLRLPDGSYLSFFNSFVGHVEHERRYVIGAYIFSGREHGFKVTHVINAPLLVGSEREGFLWESPIHWEPVVVFATGAAFEPYPVSGMHEPKVRLTYGINDCFAESAIIPLDSIMSRMVRV